MKIARGSFLVCLFLLFICFCIYFNSLNNNFIFDDDYLITKNLYIRNISFLPKLFKTDIFHFHHMEDPSIGQYYRPLQALSYSFDYFFWKLNPAGYRLTNIVIHALNSFLVYLVVFLLFKDKILAQLSSIFFAVHPIQSFLVSFIAGRSNLLETFFVFSSLAAFIYYSTLRKKAHYVLSLLLFVFALLSREGALLLPFFILFCSLFLNNGFKRTFACLVPFFFISFLYIALHMKFMPVEKLVMTDLFSLKKISGFIWHIEDYLTQLILPVDFYAALSGKAVFFKYILFSAAFAIIFYSLLKIIAGKDKITAFAAGFYILGLLPVIQLTETIAYFGAVLSEHYVYIASAGFFVFAAYLARKLYARSKKIAAVCLAAVIALYSALTIKNNYNYKDDITFYKHLLCLDRKHVFVRVNLGTAYYKKKMYPEAEREARFVLAAQPGAWDAYLLLGNVMKDKGELDSAVELYNKALILYPKSSEALNNIALIYKTKGRNKEAYDFFRKALEVNPESLLALKNIASFLIENKLFDEALADCKKILKLNPADEQAYVMLGIIFAESGRIKEAEAFFYKALNLDPSSCEALKNLGALYANTGDLGRAIPLWEKAEILNPQDHVVKEYLKEGRRIRDAGNE